jgi:hypothetical protein
MLNPTAQAYADQPDEEGFGLELRSQPVDQLLLDEPLPERRSPRSHRRITQSESRKVGWRPVATAKRTGSSKIVNELKC